MYYIKTMVRERMANNNTRSGTYTPGIMSYEESGITVTDNTNESQPMQDVNSTKAERTFNVSPGFKKPLHAPGLDRNKEEAEINNDGIKPHTVAKKRNTMKVLSQDNSSAAQNTSQRTLTLRDIRGSSQRRESHEIHGIKEREEKRANPLSEKSAKIKKEERYRVEKNDSKTAQNTEEKKTVFHHQAEHDNSKLNKLKEEQKKAFHKYENEKKSRINELRGVKNEDMTQAMEERMGSGRYGPTKSNLWKMRTGSSGDGAVLVQGESEGTFERLGNGLGAIKDKVGGMLPKVAAVSVTGVSAGMLITTSSMTVGQVATYKEATVTTNTFISKESCPNAYEIYTALKNCGLTDVSACAILGNLFQECGGSGTHDLNPQSGDGESVYGLAQWTPPTGLYAYAEEKGLDYSTIETQTAYLKYSMKDHWHYLNETEHVISVKALLDGGYLKQQYKTPSEFFKITDLKEATAAFLGYYEECIRGDGEGGFSGRIWWNGELRSLNRAERCQYEMETRYNLASACYLAFVPGASDTESGWIISDDWENVSGYKTDIGYVQFALNIADDDSIGYCQNHRTGEIGYDCASLVFYALKNTGYDLNGYPFTTYNMGEVLMGLGFTRLTYAEAIESGLKEGDILVVNNDASETYHTEIYIGNGQTVGAKHSDGWGIGCGDKDNPDFDHSDQSGTEICTGPIADYWQYVYRKGV